MTARLIYIRGRLHLAWLDSFGEGLPISDTRRAWRALIYRPPVEVQS